MSTNIVDFSYEPYVDVNVPLILLLQHKLLLLLIAHVACLVPDHHINTLKRKRLDISADKLLSRIGSLSIKEALQLLSAQFPGRVTFSTSFSMEDQVITHDILSNNIPITIFSLDTGRLFPETYSVWSSTNDKYTTHIKAYYPNHELLESFIEAKGPNSFYESVENRKECCFIRKVEPLKRALHGNAVWVTGLRAEHSPDRKDLPMLEWDESNKILKYHPLLHWSTAEVRNYISDQNIPYNTLHDKGFISIGCAPCTRAIKPGEDFRAGRWWWEDQSKKECGLHVHVEPTMEQSLKTVVQ